MSGVYGDYLQHAQGEDVVSGIRNTVSLSDLAELDKASYDELLEHMSVLEQRYRDMCDIEFTIEEGKLWMLQTRVGKRTPEAAFRIAHAMVGEQLVDLDEAVRRVTGAQLGRLMFPRFDHRVAGDRLTVGVSASPGLPWVGSCSTPRRPSSGAPAARTSSSYARRPTRTTCTAWSPHAAP